MRGKYSTALLNARLIAFPFSVLALHQFFTSDFTRASLCSLEVALLSQSRAGEPVKEEVEMRLGFGRWMLVAALVMICCGPAAWADCGGLGSARVQPNTWQPQDGTAHLLRTAAGGHDRDFDDDSAPIVGMWHVVFTANTSSGAGIPNTVVDNALVVWHADGTEIMNSVRPPQDGNFCMGVWEQTGRFTYKLNHFAWFANAFPTNPPTQIGPPVGPTQITETVILAADGKSFTGHFTLTAYDTSGNVVQTFTGTLAGTRITMQTQVSDLM